MAEFRFRRISHYRYEALTEDGADIRGTIKALDYESAEDALEQDGLFVYDLKEVDAPEDLEKRCPECNHQNNWTDMVCANCGAAVRAPRVGPDRDVKLTELPEDLVVRENSDGSITLTKETDWKQFAPAISFLAAVGLFCVIVIVRSLLEHNDRATRLAGIMLALFGVVVLAACMLWTQFNREEWRVAKGFVEQRKSLFGMDQGHTFRLGIIRFSDYNQQGEHIVCVSVEDRETSRTLWMERSRSDSAGSVLAVLLAQRTGWVLDEQRGGLDGLPAAPPATQKLIRISRRFLRSGGGTKS